MTRAGSGLDIGGEFQSGFIMAFDTEDHLHLKRLPPGGAGRFGDGVVRFDPNALEKFAHLHVFFVLGHRPTSEVMESRAEDHRPSAPGAKR